MNWLKLLHQNNVNGVLADDMGLGESIRKTDRGSSFFYFNIFVLCCGLVVLCRFFMIISTTYGIYTWYMYTVVYFTYRISIYYI